MLMTPGMRKYTLIVKMLTRIIRFIRIASIESINMYENILSIIPKSFEYLLLIFPIDVISK